MTDQIPPMPEPPEDYECCNSGCEELCVFEIYRQEKQAWEQQYGSHSATQTQQPNTQN